MSYSNIEGKIAIVTGAGGGIGRAIALKLAKMGATVIVTDNSIKGAEETVNIIRSIQNSPDHEALHLDVTSLFSVDSAIEYIGNKYGKIDILCNNAGVSTMQKLENISERDWNLNFDVNIKGMFYCTQSTIKYMKKNGGRIVNTASMASLKGLPLLSHYSASKWAVAGFTKSCAVELAEYGINVNCVCPGYVKTSMQERELKWEAQLRGITDNDVLEEYIRLTPLKKLCLPEYVADAVGFLVSRESLFITGIELPITGGADLL